MRGDCPSENEKRGDKGKEKSRTYLKGPKQERIHNIDVNQRTIPEKSKVRAVNLRTPIKRCSSTVLYRYYEKIGERMVEYWKETGQGSKTKDINPIGYGAFTFIYKNLSSLCPIGTARCGSRVSADCLP